MAPAVTAAELEPRLRALVAVHLDVDPTRVVPTARLGDDLCVDSLDAVELTMMLEDEFDIVLPDELMADVRTYGDVVGMVTRQLGVRTTQP